MSLISNEKLFDKALELMRHADELTHKWATHLITVQTSLVAMEGGILAWRTDSMARPIYLVSMLVSGLGIATALSLSHIIIREHEHGHAYLKMVKRSEGEQPVLFRDEDASVPGLNFRKIFSRLKWSLVAGWTTVVIFSIVGIAA
jgi:hypothetical protein